MSVIKFDTGSYRRSGQSYLDEAADLRRAVATDLAALDVGRLGCERGSHAVDQALAMVVPPLKDAFREAVENLAANLEAVGGQLQDTAARYDDMEASHVDASDSIPGGF